MSDKLDAILAGMAELTGAVKEHKAAPDLTTLNWEQVEEVFGGQLDGRRRSLV